MTSLKIPGRSVRVGKCVSTDQDALFGTPDVARARKTDPITSHNAARKVPVTHHQELVLAALITGPATHEELQERIRHYWPNENPSEQSIRSRCKQLVNKGLVRMSNERGITSRGNACSKWELA